MSLPELVLGRFSASESQELQQTMLGKGRRGRQERTGIQNRYYSDWLDNLAFRMICPSHQANNPDMVEQVHIGPSSYSYKALPQCPLYSNVRNAPRHGTHTFRVPSLLDPLGRNILVAQ